MMKEQDIINIINLIEHPNISLSLKELGILSYLKVEDTKIIAVFSLPDITMPDRKDLANSVKIIAESFGYKFEYDFRPMNKEEIKIYIDKSEKNLI